jgi:RNA polymerase sigma-B factor
VPEIDLNELLKRASGGDGAARDEVVERFLPLARRLARRYARPGQPLDDLAQVATVGLIAAVDRYDPERGTSFLAFAMPTINGELKRHLRDSGWAVHVPRALQERALAVTKHARELSAKLGRPPTATELAATTDWSVEDVMDALDAAESANAESLEFDDGDGEVPSRVPADVDERLVSAVDRTTVRVALRSLRPDEREVLLLRFAGDLTQTEIADRIGCSQMQVSRLLRRGLAHLRTQLEPGQAFDD